MVKRIAVVLLTFGLMAVTHSVRACTVFPQRYVVSHEALVARAHVIALVEAIERAKDPAGHAVMRFRVIEVLKGAPGKTVTVPEEVYGPPLSQRDRTDFDRHRDPGFWPATKTSFIPRNRSRGSGTDCVLGFRFHVGDRYLGFLENGTPQHVHAFERIVHADDAWLGRVRRLIGNAE